jgi:hypothetical protein
MSRMLDCGAKSRALCRCEGIAIYGKGYWKLPSSVQKRSIRNTRQPELLAFLAGFQQRLPCLHFVSIVLQFGCFDQMPLGVSEPELHIRSKMSAKIVYIILLAR